MTATRRLGLLVAAILVAAILSGYALGAASAFDSGARTTSIEDYDDAIAKKNAEREEAERRAEDLEHQLENTDAAIVEADRQLRDLNAKLPALQEELELAEQRVEAALVAQAIVEDKLAAARAQDQAISDQIAADAERTEELESLVAAIARETYKGADATASLGIVFGSADTQEFVDDFTAQQSASRVQSNALAELEEIAAVNRNRGARQDAVRVYIEELKVEADELVVELEGARAVAQDKRDAVQDLLDEQKELRDYLESQRAAFIQQQQENEALQEQLRSQVLTLFENKRKAEEEARRKAEAAGGGGTLGRGSLAFPTKVPYITSNFGMRYHPIYNYPRLHAGTDFRAYCGTPIYAAATGTVEWAKYQPGYGNQVLMDHGLIGGKSVITNYNHLSSFAVSSGQTVARGDLLGYSGNTGSSTACHLHFEVYVSGIVKNPMTYLPSL